MFYSQFEEDKILAEIFQDKVNGFYIDIGAYDGVEGSNSYYFDQKGWKGICVEPISKHCQKMQSQRKNSLIINAALNCNSKPTKKKFFIIKNIETLSTLNLTKSHLERINTLNGITEENEVDCYSLNYLLDEHKNFLQKIDFVSIDVEGEELAVLKGFDLIKYSPRILIIEDNYDGLNNRVEKYFKKYGYKLFIRTGCNDWYLKKDDFLFKNN